jgi:hypothetical protein
MPQRWLPYASTTFKFLPKGWELMVEENVGHQVLVLTKGLGAYGRGKYKETPITAATHCNITLLCIILSIIQNPISRFLMSVVRRTFTRVGSFIFGWTSDKKKEKEKRRKCYHPQHICVLWYTLPVLCQQKKRCVLFLPRTDTPSVPRRL